MTDTLKAIPPTTTAAATFIPRDTQMEILNLDNFAEVKRQVTIAGVTHDILEISVQDFVNNLKAAELLDEAIAKGEQPVLASIDLAVNSICASVPSLDEAAVRQLKLSLMYKLLAFIRGELDPVVAQGAPAAEGADAKKA